MIKICKCLNKEIHYIINENGYFLYTNNQQFNRCIFSIKEIDKINENTISNYHWLVNKNVAYFYNVIFEFNDVSEFKTIKENNPEWFI